MTELSPTPLTDALRKQLLAAGVPVPAPFDALCCKLERSLAEREARIAEFDKRLALEREKYKQVERLLEARNAELRQALKEYGDHKVPCGKRSFWASQHQCSCGFSAALTEQQGGKDAD